MRPDIEQAIKAFGNKKSQPNKKELKAVENLLRADETVIFIADTILEVSTSGKKKEKFPGVCVLTSKRFLHHKNEYKLLGIGVGGDSTETLSLDRIDSVNALSTIAYNHVQFHAMTKSYDILCSSKKEMKSLRKHLKQQFRITPHRGPHRLWQATRSHKSSSFQSCGTLAQSPTMSLKQRKPTCCPGSDT